MNQMKFKIPEYDKYTNYFLSALLFVIDYLSIVFAEQSAFVLNNIEANNNNFIGEF